MVRTKGDLCALCAKTETTYGVPVAGDADYMGTLLTFKSPDAFTSQELTNCGHRVRGGVFRVSQEVKYSATFNAVKGKSVTSKWLAYAVGGTSVASDLDSLTTVINVGGQNKEYHEYTGCMVNQLSISASEIGGYIEYAVDTIGRWHTLGNDYSALKDADGSVLPAVKPVAVPIDVPVTYNAYWKYRTSSTGNWTELKGNSWTLTISNNLQTYPDVSASVDGFRLEAGQKSVPQASELTLSVTFPSTDSTWDAMRLAYTTGMEFQLTIDGVTVTLTGCNLDASMPDRKSESGYDETVQVTATDITIG